MKVIDNPVHELLLLLLDAEDEEAGVGGREEQFPRVGTVEIL